MRKCKRGSTLVLVLVIFSVLSILGTAFLGLTLSNYKYNIVKGKVKENLYASEAGIDESYKIISSVIDSAINDSNTKIDEFTKEEMDKEIEKQQAKAQEIINNPAEKATWEANWETNWDSTHDGNDYITVDSSGTFNTDELKNQQKIRFKADYKSYIEDKLFKNAGSTVTLNDTYSYELSGIKPVVTVVGAKPSFAGELLSVNLKSSFKDVKGIEKIIGAIYDISVPEYGQEYNFSTNTIKIPNMVWSKALTVDGNMFVTEGALTVGQKVSDIEMYPADIYVKGINGANGGINFNDQDSNTTIIGDISTAEDFTINKKSDNTIYGNIFAKNLIVSDGATGSNLKVNKIAGDTESGSVYTTDDLELNANNSNIDIKGSFYGIDDGSLDDINEFTNNKFGQANKSSTIIVNADLNSGSSLAIAGDSIISGVGYIDVPYVNSITSETGQYQTGESVAIKGNYRAYMYPLTGGIKGENDASLEEDNVAFGYFEPLTLASTLNSEKRALSAQEKSIYFKAYNDEYKDKGGSGLVLDGVSLGGGTISTGAIVSGGVIKPQNIPIEEGIIIKKRNEFNKMVNNMGVKVEIPASAEEKKDTYPNAPNKIFGNSSTDACKIDSSKLVESDKLENQELILIHKGSYILDFNSDAKKAAKKGIIIVTGDLTIKGDMDFTGTIIVGGNLTFQGSEEKKLKYDRKYISELIISNYTELFNDVFINDNPKNGEEAYDIFINSSYGLKIDGDKLIQKDNLIKIKNWTISK